MEMLEDMQFWHFKVKEKVGTLFVVADSGYAPAISQEIPWTDFPLEKIKIWVERGHIPYKGKLLETMVAMLPGER